MRGMSKSYAFYRFYRREFTPLMRVILASVFLSLVLMAVVFSPRIVFEGRAGGSSGAPVEIVDGVSEEENLRDSEPLFLPTGRNFRSAHLQAELKMPFLSSFSFGGLRLLGNFDERGFSAAGAISSGRIAELFPAKSWRIASGFGSVPAGLGLPDGEPFARLSVTESGTGRAVSEAVLPLRMQADVKMLLAPIEIICYGAPESPQAFVVQSCGNAETDGRVLEFVRSWAGRNLRARGVFLVRVGA